MDIQEKGGLQGLGNINTDNASATVSTPYGYLNKNDTDDRKIPTDFSKFNTSADLANGLIKWLSSSCGLQSSLSTDVESDRIAGSQAIYLDMNGQIFKIYCIQNPDMAVSFAGAQAILNMVQAKLVLFGSYSAPKFSALEKQLRQNNIEAFSIEDIYDINEAVDHADRGFPYVGMGTDLNNQLAKLVNAKYKGKIKVYDIESGKEATPIGELGQSFKSGFEQLKDSVTGVLGSLKGATGQMPGATGEYHHEVPPQFGTDGSNASNSQFGVNQGDNGNK